MMMQMSARDWTAAVRIAAKDVAGPRRPGPAVVHRRLFHRAARWPCNTRWTRCRTPTLRRPDRVLLVSPAIALTRVAALAEVIDIFTVVPLPELDKARWQEIAPEFDPYKFNSFPVNASRQINRATRALQRSLAGSAARPCLVGAVAAGGDLAVGGRFPLLARTAWSTRFMRGCKAPAHRLVLFDMNRLPEMSGVARPTARALIERIERAPRGYTLDLVSNAQPHRRALQCAGWRRTGPSSLRATALDWPANLVSLGHVALPFPPDDPVYGFLPGSGRDGIPSIGSWLLRGENGAIKPGAGLADATAQQPVLVVDRRGRGRPDRAGPGGSPLKAQRTRSPGTAPGQGSSKYRPGWAVQSACDAASNMPSPRPNFNLRGARWATTTVGSPTAARTVLATRVCLSAREASSAFQFDSCATQLRKFRQHPPRTHSMPLLQICLPRAASHHLPATMRRPTALAVTVWVLVGGTAQAQPAPMQAESVVISGSGVERRAFETPYAVSVIDAAELRSAGPMVNLSEALARVPGLVVTTRNNYAQDLQISSRGFGARASFGVRGLRLYTDGIPATMPDGQGQVSHFDLAGAQRIEVLRGPFSALYGNNSGGVISLVSAAPARAQLQRRRRRRQLRPAAGAPGRRRAAGRRLELPRPGQPVQHRRLPPAQRGAAHAGQCAPGLGRRARTRVTLLLNSVDQPAQDPLGLTRDAVRCRPLPDHAAGDRCSTPARPAARPRAAPTGGTASPTPARCARARSRSTPANAT